MPVLKVLVHRHLTPLVSGDRKVLFLLILLIQLFTTKIFNKVLKAFLVFQNLHDSREGEETP